MSVELDWNDTTPPNLMVIGDAISVIEQGIISNGIELPKGYAGCEKIMEQVMFEEIQADVVMPAYKMMSELDLGQVSTDDLSEMLMPIIQACKESAQASDQTEVDSEDVITLNDSDERDDLHNFIEEALEQVNDLENDLPSLNAKKTDNTFLNSLFRKIHTIKGAAGFFSLNHLTHITHELESVLDRARNGKLDVDEEVINLLIKGTGWLKEHLQKIEECLEIDSWPAEIVVDKCNSDPIHFGCLAVLARPVVEVDIDLSGDGSGEKSDTEAKIQISQSYLDQFIGDVGDLLNLAHIFKHSETVLENSGLEKSELYRFKENFFALEDKTEGLQKKLMQLRRVKIKKLLDKVPKIIFKLSQTVGKKVDVVCEGEDVEIDRSMLKVLEDPFVHILRNSMDHGFETAEEREEIGKPLVGIFKIEVSQGQNNVIVVIKDDGRGINGDIVAEKAIEKGIITEAKVNALSAQQKQELIFMPGFSTREEASEISGRGVGMDVVRKSIIDGGGKVALKSELGKGTTLILTIPVAATISTRSILRLKSAGYWLGVPMDKVQYLSTLSDAESAKLPRSNEMELFPFRGHNIPIISVNEVFKEERKIGVSRSFIVVEFGNSFIAFEVDEIHEFEIHVLQDFLQGHMDGTPFEGASVMGDGSICLMLSFKRLLEMSNLKAGMQDAGEVLLGTDEENGGNQKNTLIVRPSQNSFMVSLDMDYVNRIENFQVEKLSYLKGQRIYQATNGLRQFYELHDFGIGVGAASEQEMESVVILQLGDKQIALGVLNIIDMYSGEINHLGKLHLHGMGDSWSYNDELVAELNMHALQFNNPLKLNASGYKKQLSEVGAVN